MTSITSRIRAMGLLQKRHSATVDITNKSRQLHKPQLRWH